MKLDRIEPLAALGIELLGATAAETRFRIALVGNRNDKGSLFAGSQYAALVVAGWYHSGRWAEQHDLGDAVAIRDGQVRYPKPALSDLTVTARFTAAPDQRPSGHWRALVQVQAHDTAQALVAELNADYRILVG